MGNQNQYNRTWMEKQKKEGLCQFCRLKKLPDNATLCETHYFYRTAIKIGDKNLAKGLQEIYYMQEGKCYLSGEKLILGKNTSIDHVIPISVSPELATNLGNLRWTTEKINRFKNEFTYNELLRFCKNIIKHSYAI